MNARQRLKYDSHLALRRLCAKDTSLALTSAKNAARHQLIESILQTAGALCTLALLREDPAPEAQADILPSDLAALPDSLVDDKATELLQLARAVPAPGPGVSPGVQMRGARAGPPHKLSCAAA